ncbi:unnamed protein product [Cylindrotheca closterium]|uniref:Uncharacterized protein n=1 Tax=Cylindrotheca closterium TaxID=2856 RepID=A0AAD2PW78_9STRA|nr:unnamed protein product [Cylindrotheca closterium]
MLDKANQTYAMEFKEYDQQNKYPTMIDQVAKALIKHKPDNRKKGPTTPRPTPSTTTMSSSAPDGVSNAQANARTSSSRPAYSCLCCRDTGHGVTPCPERSTRPQAERSDPGQYSDAPTTTTTTSRRAGRANLQVPAAASAAQSDAASKNFFMFDQRFGNLVNRSRIFVSLVVFLEFHGIGLVCLVQHALEARPVAVVEKCTCFNGPSAAHQINFVLFCRKTDDPKPYPGLKSKLFPYKCFSLGP